VPLLLEVPVEPLVDGSVELELPDEPMPEVLPEVEPVVDGLVLLLDVDGVLLVDVEGVVLLELPPVAPMPDVEPEVDEPLVMPLDDDDGREVEVDEDEGLVEPVADPPAAPMPDVDPVAEPVELQAARAAEQARTRMSLFIRESPFACPDAAECRAGEPQA